MSLPLSECRVGFTAHSAVPEETNTGLKIFHKMISPFLRSLPDRESFSWCNKIAIGANILFLTGSSVWGKRYLETCLPKSPTIRGCC